MTGKGHLASNTCSLVAISSVTILLTSEKSSLYNEQLSNTIKLALDNYILKSSLPMVLFATISILLFYLGTLLPDIDFQASLLGRFLYLPIEHRSWTHAIYLPIIFGVASIWFRPLLFLSLGYVLHLLWDNLSKAGICFLYPLNSKKTRYGIEKKRHILRFYKSGKASEYVLLGVILSLTIVLIIFTIITMYN